MPKSNPRWKASVSGFQRKRPRSSSGMYSLSGPFLMTGAIGRRSQVGFSRAKSNHKVNCTYVVSARFECVVMTWPGRGT